MFSCLRKKKNKRISKMQAAVVEASSKHTATLIFLHGLGDSGHGWSEILGKMKPAHFKVVCPHAPQQKVTLNAGMRMPAWFDIFDLRPGAQQDEPGIVKASQNLEEMVVNEMSTSGLPGDRIIIGGFSQGGAIALYTTLVSEKISVAGATALSSWLPLHTKFQSTPQIAKVRKDMPIFQAHGASDQMVPSIMGQMTSQFLNALLGMSAARFKIYPGLEHSSCDQELQDLVAFMNKCCPATA